MIKQTIHAIDFGKKQYAKPLIKVHQVKPATILAGSDCSTQSTELEDFEYGGTL